MDLDVDTNPLTLFNLVRQVLIREFDPQPWRHIQVRAFSTPIDVDVVVALADPGARESGAFDDVRLQLKADGLRVRETNGSKETAGFECDNQLLVKSLRLGRQAQAATLWLAPNLRTQFRTHVDDALQAAEFQAVQIPTVMASIEEHLTALANETVLQPYDGPFQTIVSSYLISRNVIELRRLQQLWSEAVWTRVVDVESEQSYLIHAMLPVPAEPGRVRLEFQAFSTAEKPVPPQTVELHWYGHRAHERRVTTFHFGSVRGGTRESFEDGEPSTNPILTNPATDGLRILTNPATQIENALTAISQGSNRWTCEFEAEDGMFGCDPPRHSLSPPTGNPLW